MASDTIVKSLKEITQQGVALQDPVQSLSIINAIMIFGQITDGFAKATSTGEALIPQMEEMQSVLLGAPSDAVSEAFHELVQTYEALLTTLTSKASILEQFSFAEPTAVLLRAFEDVFGRLSFVANAIVPTKSGDLTTAANNLSTALTSAISRYS